MEKPVSWRTRLAAFGGLLAVTAALFAVTGSAASAATVTQNGLNNYAGPKACPQPGFDQCTNATDVSQTSSGGHNVYEAQGSGGTVTQSNTTGANDATCNISVTAAPPNPVSTVPVTTSSDQNCAITQTGDGGNTINANMTATHNAGIVGGLAVNLRNITQYAAQHLITTQNSTTGNNALTATETITEQSNSLVDANTPVSHVQDSLDFANVTQIASGAGSNSATVSLNRTQNSQTRGGPSTEYQDRSAVTDSTACQGAVTANGRLCVYQRANGSTSTNQLTIRASDTKTADGNDLTAQRVTQQQGLRDQTEWVAQFDVLSPNNIAGSNVDVGQALGTEGMKKDWTMTSLPATTQDRHQFDEIRLPSIGKSPCFTKSHEESTLRAPAGTEQIIELYANGHADCEWHGDLHAVIFGGGTTPTDDITYEFRGTDIDASLICARNGGTGCVRKGISGAGVNFSTTEGATFNGPVATFNDPQNGSGYTASIDWGDGTTSSGTVSGSGSNISVSGSHAYEDAGTYTVETSLKKNSSVVGKTTATATVADAPISAAGKNLYSSSKTFSGVVATLHDDNPLATTDDFTVTFNWGDGGSSAGSVTKTSAGNFNLSGTHTYAAFGPHDIQTHVVDRGGQTADATSHLETYGAVPGGAFTVGDLTAAHGVGTKVTWWGSQWTTDNDLSGTEASSFKGFENSSANPACGGTWTSTTGNSPPPASQVPDYMAVIVTSKAAQVNSSKISGDVKYLVIVHNDPGYTPDPATPGKGTITAVIPCS